MAPKKVTDSTIVLFDVGRNTKEHDESKSQTFYEQAKSCLEAILMRKIFTRPTDEFALFLIGSKTTSNPMNTENDGEYSYINQALDMNPINWDMLKFIKNELEEPNDDTTGDWLDAIIVAADYFSRLQLENTTKKILLFTTFSTEVNGASIDAVIAGLKQLDIELIVVTKNVVDEPGMENDAETVAFSQSMEKDHTKEKCEALIMDIVKQANGSLCNLDEAVAKLMYVDKKQRRRMPWNADLTFGTLFTIKIAAYIYVEDKSDLGTWKTRTATGETCKSRIENYHNDTLIDPVTVETELVKGYMYGAVPVSYNAVEFSNGGKGLKCIGFTKASTISKEDLKGSSIRMVIPQKNFESSAKRFSALLEAMRNLDLVIIARYTYHNSTSPAVMALFPHDDKSMLMHELFFKDNMISMSFPPLDTRKFTPSAEQSEFMDKFIDSMDLTENPSFKQFDSLMDPGLQHMYRVIAHRAINPNDPVPNVDKDLLALISPPKPDSIDIVAMKELFPLEEIKLTTKEKLLKNIQSGMVDDEVCKASLNSNANQQDIEITKIGTIQPTEDFLLLLASGEKFTDLIKQLQDVVVQLATKTMVAMDDKISKALLAYRENAKQKGAHKYNEWIGNFKELLKEREKVQLWEMIINERLGLITNGESEISTVTNEEAAAFYKDDGFYTQVNQSSDMNTGDDDDLLDEM